MHCAHNWVSSFFSEDTHFSSLFETKQRDLTSTACPRGASALRTCCSGGGKSPLSLRKATCAGSRDMGGPWSPAFWGRRRPWGAPPPPNRGSPPGVGGQRVPLPPRPRRPPQASRKHPSSVLPFVFSPPPSPQGRPAAGWSRPGAWSAGAPGGPTGTPNLGHPRAGTDPLPRPALHQRPQAFPVPCSTRGSIVAADFPRQLQLPNSSVKN